MIQSPTRVTIAMEAVKIERTSHRRRLYWPMGKQHLEIRKSLCFWDCPIRLENWRWTCRCLVAISTKSAQGEWADNYIWTYYFIDINTHPHWRLPLVLCEFINFNLIVWWYLIDVVWRETRTKQKKLRNLWTDEWRPSTKHYSCSWMRYDTV